MIGVSLLALDDPFFRVIGDNITAEGAKRGHEAIVVSGDTDVAKQGNQIAVIAIIAIGMTIVIITGGIVRWPAISTSTSEPPILSSPITRTPTVKPRDGSPGTENSARGASVVTTPWGA